MGFGLARKQFLLLKLVIMVAAFLLIMIGLSDHYVEKKNWRGLKANEAARLSKLGRILFLQEDKLQRKNKNYVILVWKYGKFIERRHMKNFGNTLLDPFRHCSVNNCKITYNSTSLKSSDLVLFHLQRMHEGDLPVRPNRHQIWAFLTDESPFHTNTNPKRMNYNGVFNWSVTYRSDSDIPVPYGRTVLRQTPLAEDLILRKNLDVLVAVMGSNCGSQNKRWQYVKELQKHIHVDFYGGCGTIKCKGHFDSDCPQLDQYLFYLAFENSNCEEYVTEKLWWNAYHKNSIPVVMGASKESYRRLLPPNSYLNVEDFAQPKDLAEYILYLNRTHKFLELYEWKKEYEVLQEHGYFGSESFHYCRICEALNYNDRREKVYGDLSEFWSVKNDCHPAWS